MSGGLAPREVRAGERADDLTEFPSRCPRSISPSIAETMMEAVGMETTSASRPQSPASPEPPSASSYHNSAPPAIIRKPPLPPEPAPLAGAASPSGAGLGSAFACGSGLCALSGGGGALAADAVLPAAGEPADADWAVPRGSASMPPLRSPLPGDATAAAARARVVDQAVAQAEARASERRRQRAPSREPAPPAHSCLVDGTAVSGWC